jgi:hypothetical protein
LLTSETTRKSLIFFFFKKIINDKLILTKYDKTKT